MDFTHLPPSMVEFLDALARTPDPPEEQRVAFLQVVDDLSAWARLEGSFTISEQEATEFENLRVSLHLLESVRGERVRWLSLDELLDAGFAALRLMRDVEARRGRAEYARDPLVNGFILCGVAVLQGRGEVEALRARLPALRTYSEWLRELQRTHQPRLRPEVAQAIEVGLQSWEKSLLALEQAAEPPALQDALAQLKEAAEITQHLLDYDRREVVVTRLHIPRLAPALELLLETAAQWSESERHERLGRLLDEAVPAFDTFWERAQQSLIAPEPERTEVLEQIWQTTDALVEQLRLVREDGVAQLGPLEEICQQLSEAFAELTGLAPPSAHLRGTQAGDYYTYMAGLLRRTLPAHAIPSMLRLSPPPEPWTLVVRSLQAYQQNGDPEELRQGMLELLRLCPPVEAVAAPDFWDCPYCGRSVAVGERTCAHCNGTPGLADLQAPEFLA